MRKHLTLLAAASLTAGTFAFLGYDNTLLAQGTRGPAAPGQRGVAMPEARAQLPQGITRAPQTDEQGIQSTLANATNAAITSLDQLTNYFTQSDRQRLANFGQQEHERLRKALGTFRANWQNKYKQDFNMGGKAQVVFGDQFRGFEVVQGEVTNPALLGNWPVEPGQQQMQQEYQQDRLLTGPEQQRQQQQMHQQQQMQQQPGTGEQQPGIQLEEELEEYREAGGPGQPQVELIPDQEEREQFGEIDEMNEGAVQAGQVQRPRAGAAAQLQRGMNVAIAHFPSGYGLPETTVSLVRHPQRGAAQAAGGMRGQAGEWLIDIPDNVNAEQLATRLANHIEGLNAGFQSWPNDVNEAYRLVSHHVMEAIYETTGPQQAGQMQQPGQQ